MICFAMFVLFFFSRKLLPLPKRGNLQLSLIRTCMSSFQVRVLAQQQSLHTCFTLMFALQFARHERTFLSVYAVF